MRTNLGGEGVLTKANIMMSHWWCLKTASSMLSAFLWAGWSYKESVTLPLSNMPRLLIIGNLQKKINIFLNEIVAVSATWHQRFRSLCRSVTCKVCSGSLLLVEHVQGLAAQIWRLSNQLGCFQQLGIIIDVTSSQQTVACSFAFAKSRQNKVETSTEGSRDGSAASSHWGRFCAPCLCHTSFPM